MLFYSTEPNLTVISRKTKQPIARFKDGKLNTYDTALIERLKPHFKHRKNPMADLNELRSEIKDRGIKLHRGTTQKEMIKILEESEEND